MSRRRIKICGITRAEDAQLAASLGADAIGLVFHPPSSRVISPDAILSVVDKLPAFVTVVGLFVDPAEELVRKVLASGRVQCLQFHGDESVRFCQSFGVPFIKAIRVRDLDQARQQLQPFHGLCSVILDSYTRGIPGGTGKVFDWNVARQLVADGHNPVILAGGLAPDNVASAIEAVSPYGVDVSSGVEQQPGIKDPDRLQRFFNAVYQ